MVDNDRGLGMLVPSDKLVIRHLKRRLAWSPTYSSGIVSWLFDTKSK